MLLLGVVCILLAVGALLIALLYPRFKKGSAIPGLAPSDPIAGNLPDISKYEGLPEFLLDLHRKFGPIASFWMGKVYVVCISSPELMKETAHLFNRPELLFKFAEPLIGPLSIQLASGPEAQQRRQLQNRYFTHGKILKHLALFNEISNELCTKWDQMADGVQHVPLSVHMTNTAAKILMRSLFGDYFKDEKALMEFRDYNDKAFVALDEAMKSGADPNEDLNLRTALSNLKKTVKEIIKDREKAEYDADDMLLIDEMIHSYDNEDKLFSDCVTFIAAGFHTTTYFMVWVVYYLALHREVQEKLYQEVKSFIPADGQISWEQMKEMKYLHQVLNETLRITGVGPHSSRFSEKDMVLGGHHIPKSTPIIQSLVATCRDEKLWPEPNVFNPDRFADMSKIPAYAFEPFGFAGKRKCPGYRMSEYESQVIISALVNKFKITLVPGQTITYKYHLTPVPSDEVWLTLEKRN